MKKYFKRLNVFLNIRLPKLCMRRLRMYIAAVKINGKLPPPEQKEKFIWWHRNSGRYLSLSKKWFPDDKYVEIINYNI